MIEIGLGHAARSPSLVRSWLDEVERLEMANSITVQIPRTTTIRMNGVNFYVYANRYLESELARSSNLRFDIPIDSANTSIKSRAG